MSGRKKGKLLEMQWFELPLNVTRFFFIALIVLNHNLVLCETLLVVSYYLAYDKYFESCKQHAKTLHAQNIQLIW